MCEIHTNESLINSPELSNYVFQLKLIIQHSQKENCYLKKRIINSSLSDLSIIIFDSYIYEQVFIFKKFMIVIMKQEYLCNWFFNHMVNITLHWKTICLAPTNDKVMEKANIKAFSVVLSYQNQRAKQICMMYM